MMHLGDLSDAQRDLMAAANAAASMAVESKRAMDAVREAVKKGLGDAATAAKGFQESQRKAAEETSKSIEAASKQALGGLGNTTAGLGAAFGASGGNFGAVQTQLGRNVAAQSGNMVSGIGGMVGGAFGGPLGAKIGEKIGQQVGEMAGGALNREIDKTEIPLEGAKASVSDAAYAAGRYGMKYSDEALKRALEFAYQFEKRGYAERRRVIEMDIRR